MFLQATDYNLLKIFFIFEVLRGGAGYVKASIVGYWFTMSTPTLYRYLSRLTKGGYLSQSLTETARGDVKVWQLTKLGRRKVVECWPYLNHINMYPEKLENIE